MPSVSTSRNLNSHQEEEAIDTFGDAIDDFEQVVNAFLHHRFALRSTRLNKIIRLTQVIIEHLQEDGPDTEPNYQTQPPRES